MVKRLPKEVLDFLRANSKEVERIQTIIQVRADDVRRAAEYAEKRKRAKQVPCGMYGCTTLKNELDVMCKDCLEEYREDPDAFK